MREACVRAYGIVIGDVYQNLSFGISRDGRNANSMFKTAVSWRARFCGSIALGSVSNCSVRPETS